MANVALDNLYGLVVLDDAGPPVASIRNILTNEVVELDVSGAVKLEFDGEGYWSKISAHTPIQFYIHMHSLLQQY